MIWWFYDPLVVVAMFLAYIIGFITLNIIASLIAPRVARKLSNKFSFYTSMYIAGAIVFVGGFSAIYILWLIIENLGYSILFTDLIIFVIIMNVIMYIISPVIINVSYGAQHDPELQRLVDEAARRAGMKPPKAMIVNGPPNAFAYGNFLTGKYVAVTTGMLGIVDRNELLGVIGHELGHHKHRDNFIMLFMGIIPSIIYYLGLVFMRAGLTGGYGRQERGGNPLLLLLLGVGAILLSLIIQVFILAFSRLREYYADAHGAYVAGNKEMQRALAKLHMYYSYNKEMREHIDSSKLRTLFIYALTDAIANPFYPYSYRKNISYRDIDEVIEKIKNSPVDPAKEVLSSHPPIPKRLRFLDNIFLKNERIR
ncbi:HtpX-2 peptidase. Metallo peptidase. MEROPS family M48B [Staphylothermus marinus F1]|uniref:Protease HtpX homolog n=1 Tax=Staphylothermus marinus (strain ATCC 43588 / DSM 3639 / JCM 9404 / F1) TaxID=399550 RepID=A3DP55_STAMF|nr:zinc metalloprotease HtpX [Staphylothermus marinus]ABN70415.1 HtpX-2 peptidase. Metallo peptidase. MEROPS family M48B [Staphylothermus marinus F1]